MIPMVDSVFYAIKDSLIVRALLDPSMDLRNVIPSQAQAANKKALVNRVKKLDDDTRLELMSELNRILLLLKNDPKVGPLQERGLCVVLLTDDGTQANSRGFFETICQIFKNFCGYSASSDTIVNKIIEVQAELEQGRIDAVYDQPQAQMTSQQIGSALQSAVAIMHQKQSSVEAKVAEKNAQFERLKTDLYELKRLMPSEEFDLVRTTNFVNKINAISTFVTNDNALVKSFKGHPTKINSIVACIVSVNRRSYNDLVKELQKNELPLTQSEKNELSSLNDTYQFSPEQETYLRKLVLSVASRNIQMFIEKINIESIKLEQEKLKSSKLIELVEIRQRLLSEHELSLVSLNNRAIASQEIRALLVQNKEASKAENDLNPICKSVDDLLAASNKVGFEDFVNTYKHLVSHGIDEGLKKPHNYLQKLVYVSSLLNGETHMLEEMANSFKFDTYLPQSESDPAQRDLYLKLKPFVDQKAAFPLHTQEDRKALAIAYLNYLKFLFNAEKAFLSNAIAARDARIDKIQKTPSAQLSSLNVVAAAPAQQQPVVPVQPLQPVVNPLDQLRGHAQALYYNHYNDPQQAQGICQRLKESPLKDHAGKVYRNFYHIMKKGNHIVTEGWGWGELVFHSNDLTHVKNISFSEFNLYRAKAMYLASVDANLYDESSDNHSRIVPPLT